MRLKTTVCAMTALLGACAAPAAADVRTFRPVADTYVDASTAATSYGAGTAMWVDGSPRKAIYLRFDLQGLGAAAVKSARLRLYQKDNSVFGGRVAAVSSTTWTEAMTWETRPAIDGPAAGSFGSVSTGTWYETDVTSLVRGDGLLSLGIDSVDDDGARWQSRESTTPPELVVELADSGTVADGLATVAAPTVGSSDPVAYPANHHLEKTAGGRLLAVHGTHGQGLQLAWRDPSSSWRTLSRGASATGVVLSGTGTGDWPASIAVARDSAGTEHAWVVWDEPYAESTRPIALRRISELDSPDGPVIGPLVHLAAPGTGYRPDLAVETGPDGRDRLALAWSRNAATDVYDVMTGWITDLDSATPALHSSAVLYSSSAYNRYVTLASTPAGVRAVVRAGSSRIRVWRHDTGSALTAWAGSSSTGAVNTYPTAAGLPDGGLLVAGESNTTDHTVVVQRWSAAGTPAPAELTLTGYTDAGVVTNGSRHWLLMVRVGDGAVVSRRFAPDLGWSQSDRVEVDPAESGGNHRWINTLREADGRLRFLVRGPRGSTSNSASAVLGFQRPY